MRIHCKVDVVIAYGYEIGYNELASTSCTRNCAVTAHTSSRYNADGDVE
jgi:hypothetical protein